MLLQTFTGISEAARGTSTNMRFKYLCESYNNNASNKNRGHMGGEENVALLRKEKNYKLENMESQLQNVLINSPIK